jgi:hypothetical protein
MNFSTPGSRSAQFSGVTLWIVCAGFSAALFFVLGVLDWMLGNARVTGFMGHLINVSTPAWPLCFLIVAAAQIARVLLNMVRGKSWPWVVIVFFGGVVIDVVLARAAGALTLSGITVTGLAAATTYIFLFTRWFSGQAHSSGDK